jgi:subtilisin family serine protease
VEILDRDESSELQLDFSGKEEFGLKEWTEKFPLADGRGTAISVLDDGVALARAGLEDTSYGAPKMKAFFNTNPRWTLELRKDELPVKILLSRCGIRRENDSESVVLKQPLKECQDLGPKFSGEHTESVEVSQGEDGISFQGFEHWQPLSKNPRSRTLLEDGRAYGWDVFEEEGRVRVTFKVPERGRAAREGGYVTGSHGEGVAGIAAGFRLGGQKLDGVAPGAQVVDVHFSDDMGARNYTISMILEALLLGSKVGDVVNLSYSVFFHHAASQVAMGRMLEAALASKKALFLFSAGNNGPGIGSMNRAGIYPNLAIPVAAFLSGRLAQTTFGSADPVPMMAPYSSVGPGFDGQGGAVVASPLAGISASTADGGFQAFSGTSSATPALAGMIARLLSQIRIAELPVEFPKLRDAILQSSRPLKGYRSIEQGLGIPHLPTAYEIYRRSLMESAKSPKLVVSSQSVSPQPQPISGIYLRDGSQALSSYRWNLSFHYPPEVSEIERANSLEEIRLESSSPAIRVPDRLLLGFRGGSFQMVLDLDEISKTAVFLEEVRVTLLSTGQRLVIPVTLLHPQSLEDTFRFSMRRGEVVRIPFQVSQLNSQLALRLSERRNACMRIGVYNPSGVRVPLHQVVSVNFGGRLIESVYRLDERGVYELVLEARTNHRGCGADQSVELEAAVLWGEVRVLSLESGSGGLLPPKLTWTWVGGVSGNSRLTSQFDLKLVRPAEVEELPMRMIQGRSVSERSLDRQVEGDRIREVKLRVIDLQAGSGLIRYPYLNATLTSDRDRQSLSLLSISQGFEAKLPLFTEGLRFLEITPFEFGLRGFEFPHRVELLSRMETEMLHEVALGTLDPLRPNSYFETQLPLTIPVDRERRWECELSIGGLSQVRGSCGTVMLGATPQH